MPNVHAEDGCIEYGATVDTDGVGSWQAEFGADTVVIIEKWESLDHLKAHARSPHMAEYGAKTKDLIADRKVHILSPGLSAMADRGSGYLSGAYGLEGSAATIGFYDEWAASYEAEIRENGYATPARCAAALGGAGGEPERPLAGSRLRHWLVGRSLSRRPVSRPSTAPISRLRCSHSHALSQAFTAP